MFPAEARAWAAEKVGQPIIDFDEQGRRFAVDAPPVMSVRRDWCEHHYGLADMWQPDGTVWLDSAGEHRYEKVRELPDGVTAYQRIRRQR